MTQKGIVKSTCKHCNRVIELTTGHWEHLGGWMFCANGVKDSRFSGTNMRAEPFNFNDYLKQVEL